MTPTLPTCYLRQTYRLAFFLFCLIGIGLSNASAQIYTFTTDSTGQYNSINANVTATGLTLGYGVKHDNYYPCGKFDGLGTDGWPVTNVFNANTFNLNGDFITFTITPNMGYGLKITGFSTRSRRENINPGTADDGPLAIRYGYSTDGGSSWTTVNPGNPQSSNLCASGGVQRVWPSWPTLNVSGSIIFRIYGLSSGANMDGDLFIRDVVVDGEVCANVPAITLADNSLQLCSGGSSANLDYSGADGTSYSIVFDGAAHMAGFADTGVPTPVNFITLPSGTIAVSVPVNAPAGVYNGTLNIYNGCGFSSSQPFTIEVWALPTAALSGTQTICNGDVADLPVTLTGALPFNLTLSSGALYNGIGIFNPTLSGNYPATTTTYTVSYLVDGNGCVAAPAGLTGSATVTVNPVPSASITVSDLDICEGESVVLTFHESNYPPGTQFTVSGTATDALNTYPVLFPNIVDGTTLTLTEGVHFSGDLSITNLGVIHSTNGCKNSISDISISVNPLPQALVSISPANICPGGSIDFNLDVSNYSGANFNLSTQVTTGSGSGPQAFSNVAEGNFDTWTEGGGDFIGDISFGTFTVTETVSGCSTTTAGSSINVYDAPVFEFSAATESDPIESGNNNTGPIVLVKDFCAGNHLTLSAYDSNGALGYISSFTSTGNVTYDGAPIPLSSGDTDIPASGAATFFGSNYGGMLGYDLSSGTSGSVSQIFTPYLDNDNSGTLSPGDCEGDPMYLTYNIHAVPTLDVLPGLTVNACNGAENTINFSGNYGAGATYSWTCDNPNVGIAASGTGDITFVATNSTNAPITALVTITPSTAYCEGSSSTVMVTVYPTPTMSVDVSVAGGSPNNMNNTSGPADINADFCDGQFFSLSSYSGTAQMGMLEEIVDGTTNLLVGGFPIPVPRAQSDIPAGAVPGFFSGVHGPYGLSGGTYGWMTQVFTPYFDANNNGVFDVEIDCLGDPLSLTYRIFGPIVVDVARGAGEICSGDPVDYSITTTSSEDVTVTFFLAENTDVNSPADLDDDNVFSDPIQVTLNSSDAPYVINQAINNAVGAFDRGQVTLYISDVHYTDNSIDCGATVNNPDPNTWVYPKPFLAEPNDTLIADGGTVIFNFDPLAGLPSENPATAGFPVRIHWTATHSSGVCLVPNGLSGNTTIYDDSGLLLLFDDLTKSLVLDPGVCSGTVTFTITPESDGPQPGGGLEGSECYGDPFDVVVKVVKPLTFTHGYDGGPVTCGDMITISVDVTNFCDINSADHIFSWDPNAFMLSSYNLPFQPAVGTFSAYDNVPGELQLSFSDDGIPPYGVNIADGTVVLTYTLKAIGAAGTYNVPEGSLDEAFDGNFDAIPVDLIGATIELAPISLDIVGTPVACPGDGAVHIAFTNVHGSPTHFQVIFDGCAGFPAQYTGTFDPNDGEILIPFQNGQHSSCDAVLIVSNDAGCVSAEIPFTFTIDEVPPTASNPDPVNVTCTSQIPLPDVNVVDDEADNCSDAAHIVVAYEPNLSTTTGTGCVGNPMIINRVYSVTDQAGNTTYVTQTITALDNIPPSLNAPAVINTWYSTEAAAVAAAIAHANLHKTDNCSPLVGITVNNGTPPTYIGCTVTIHLIMADACGNITPLNYTTVIDTQNPVVTAGVIDDCYDVADVPVAPYFNYEYAVQAAIAATTASDDCDQSLDITAVVSGTLCNTIITVTATDNCGKSSSVTYQTRVENNGPVINPNNPMALNGQCFQTEQEAIDAALAITQAGDDCTAPNDIQYDAFVTGGCPGEVMVVATDYCGNPSTITYSGVFIDTEDPVVSPDEVVNNCFKTEADALAVLAPASHPSDNCNTEAELLATAEIVDVVGDPCDESITIRFTDHCERTVEITFDHIIVDDIAPEVLALAPLNYTCIDDVDSPDINLVEANDNCGVEDIIHLSTTLPTTCPGQGIRTYRVFDCAGNFTDVTQAIIVNDNILPTWITLEGDLDRTFHCGDDLTPALALAPEAEDNCGEVTITLASTTTLQDCAHSIQRTWTAMDQCGNAVAAPFVQIITIVDQAAPTWTTIKLITDVECDDQNGLNAALALQPEAEDNCSDVTYHLVDQYYTPNEACTDGYLGEWVSVWYAIDACGNASDPFSAFVDIYDNTAPVWGTPQGLPYPNGLDGTIQCNDQEGYDFLNSLAPSASDACSNASITKVQGMYVSTGDCSGEGSFTNTWTAVDDCGNVSEVFTQVIHVVDTQAPTFDPGCQFMPLNLFTSPDIESPAADCHEGISLTVGQVIDVNTPWTVAGVTIPNMGGCVSDNGCSPSGSIVVTVMSITDVPGQTVTIANTVYECVRQITVSFQLKDACGNIQPELFTCVYNIIDNTAPQMFCAQGPEGGPSLPDNCYSSVAAAEAAALAEVSPCDNCTADEDLEISVVTVGTCHATVTVTVKDCAQNQTSVVFNTRIDNNGPTMVKHQIPTCFPTAAAAQIAAVNATTITDDCDPYGQLSVSTSISGTCPATVTISATDQCGNFSSVTYPGLCIGAAGSVTITQQASNGSSTCANEATALAAWLANHGGAMASGSGIQWSYPPVVFGAVNCNTHSKTTTVTFTATDGCGYTAQTTASFTVSDNTPPTANSIASTNLTCVSAIPTPNIALVTGVSDNCGTPTVAVFGTSDNGGSGCPGHPRIVVHTYSVTDNYCNTTYVTQMITVVDNVPPTFTAPANTTVNEGANCTYNATPAVTGDVTNESDNCTASGPGLQAVYTDVVTSGTGPQVKYKITRTWTLSDACGNTATPRIQIITVKDVTAPTITGCPGNVTLPGSSIENACGAYAGAMAAPGFSDNCSGASLSYSLSGATTGTGNGTIPPTLVFHEGATVVTYTVTDGVGNTAICSFTVSVNCLTISGRLIWEHNDVSGVKDGTVKLSQGAMQFGSDLSDANGNYDLTVPAAGVFRVTPVKNINRMNGVDAADATRIMKHVDFSLPITDPYQKVCADVNRSGTINPQDATLITQCIAGNPNALAVFDVFWRFTPTSFIMPVTAHQIVPTFPEFKDVTVGAVDVTGVDFFGMKIGDVDTVWANPQNKPNIGPLAWVLQDRQLVPGSEIELNFSSSNFVDLAAYQMALDFDPTVLQFVKVETTGALPMTVLDNFGAYDAALGELRSVWASSNGQTLSDGTPVFRLRFKVLAGGKKLSEVMNLDETALDCKAYNEGGVSTGMRLVFTESVGTNVALDPQNLHLELMQNRPNPFTDATTIGFILPEACKAQIRILDISGRELAVYDRSYTAGYHELDYRMENAASYGVLFCELVTPQGKRVIKMIAAH